MFNSKKFLCLGLICVIIALCTAITGPKHGKVVVCYIGTWAVYRPGRGSFAIEHIDPNVCTHLVYSFVGLNVTHDSIRSLDPWQDLTEDYGKGGFERIMKLRDRYPHLKITVAIGGWNEGSTNYSQLAAEPARRGRFVASAVDFVRKYHFDGLDLDWEFPGSRGGSPQDKRNFVLLVKELRSAFNKFNLLLTAAFGAGKSTIDSAYDVAALSVYLDYIHMMCYDYHGTWDHKTGPNAPLDSDDVLNVKFTINYMIEMGAPANKLVMGLPLYGRTFLLADSVANSDNAVGKLGQIAESTGFQGQFTRENGFMGYNEICLELKNPATNFKQYWDDVSSTPFAISDKKVITYDNEKSIRAKVEFAIRKGLAGTMVWSLDTDDFQGDCADDPVNNPNAHVNFPLMRSINSGIEQTLEQMKRDAENEINDYKERNKKDGACSNVASSSLILTIIVSYIFKLYVDRT